MYYGRLLGTLQEYAHGIRGTAYAVDESTIFVKGFSYDGTGPGKYEIYTTQEESSIFFPSWMIRALKKVPYERYLKVKC